MKPTRSMSIIVGDRRSPPPSDMNFNEHHLKSPVPCLHSQYSMPCSLNSRRNTDTHYQIRHSLLDEKIVYCRLSLAAKKDFNEEVRALLDVRKFVSDSFIVTDINKIRISEIVEEIVERLVECRHLDSQVADEAKGALFVDRKSLSMVLANTMQGLYKSRTDGRLAYDHSWIVATCSLSSLPKRQVAITRFPQPVNFGRQSREVRFLIIVMTPSKEKLTKSAWETGRTFATMFADIEFRRRLLRAKSHDEIKAELLIMAESLAREGENAANAATGPDADGADSKSFCVQDDKRLLPRFWHESGRQVVAPALGVSAVSASHNNKLALATGGGSSSNKKQCSFGSNSTASSSKRMAPRCPCPPLGSGVYNDLRRRLTFYLSDFTDGFLGERSLYKTISTTIFLYFSLLLPCIAFGVVDTNNTDGAITPKKTMVGQALGGLFFALFGGQPLIVVMTTAPLCIYVKVIYQISQDLEVDFATFYAAVGLWMCFFLVLMALTNSSTLMKFCTRSTEDIFALFTALAFGFDGVKEAMRSFEKYYWDPECSGGLSSLPSSVVPTSGHAASHQLSTRQVPTALHPVNEPSQLLHKPTTSSNHTSAVDVHFEQQAGNVAAQPAPTNTDYLFAQHRCQRETCIFFLFLMFGTLWLANCFSSFDRTPYLSTRKREIIKDYALAFAVLILSFVGSYLFADIRLDVFEFGDSTSIHFLTNWSAHLFEARKLATSALLGSMLAVLFYIDQNICGAMVNNAPYKLKKGDYFHWDLVVLAALNAVLSLAGLPWMHGKLPHSHLHSKALADYEERVDEGHIHQIIVNIRETRLTGILVSLLVALSLLAVPYPLSYIPLPVLSGVFLYTALAEFKSNSMVERICLLFTEQAAYPPNHYIRRCPQRKIHFFTLAQIMQLAVVALVGFYPNPYVNMAFPLVVATFVPLRELLIPKLIDSKYLSSLDSPSLE